MGKKPGVINPKGAGRCTVCLDGRRALSSGSIVKVRLFEAWPKQPLLGKYFTITGQIDLDESLRGEKAKEDKMSTANL